MAEYIEREEALIICEKEYQERVKMQDWCGDTVAWNIGHAIKAIQAANVVPVVHGRWHDIYLIEPWIATGICSNCNEKSYMNPDFPFFKYCPNCGARMDGE